MRNFVMVPTTALHDLIHAGLVGYPYFVQCFGRISLPSQ
jgi:hypothetical protein